MSQQPSVSTIRPEEQKFTADLINFMATTYNYVAFLNSAKCPNSCDKSQPSTHKIKEYKQRLKAKDKETKKHIRSMIEGENRNQILNQVNATLSNMQSKSLVCLCKKSSKASNALSASRSSERTTANQQYQTPMTSAELCNQVPSSFKAPYASTPKTAQKSTGSGSPFRPPFASTPKSEIKQTSDVLNTSFIDTSTSSGLSFKPPFSSTPKAQQISDVLKKSQQRVNNSAGLSCKYFYDKKSPINLQAYLDQNISGVAPLQQSLPQANQDAPCNVCSETNEPSMRYRNVSPPSPRAPVPASVSHQSRSPTPISNRSMPSSIRSNNLDMPSSIVPEIVLPSKYFIRSINNSSSASAPMTSGDTFSSSDFSNPILIQNAPGGEEDCECDDDQIPKKFSGSTPHSKLTQCSENSSFPFITPPKITSTPKNIHYQYDEAMFAQQNTPPGNELPSRYFNPQQISASSPVRTPPMNRQYRPPMQYPPRQVQPRPQMTFRGQPRTPLSSPPRYPQPNVASPITQSPVYFQPMATSSLRQNYMPSPPRGQQLFYGASPPRIRTPSPIRTPQPIRISSPLGPRSPQQIPTYMASNYLPTDMSITCECD